jgi:hypothetical protein
VGRASRSSGLLCLEASHARVFQSGLNSGGGATTGGGGRGIIMKVASSGSRRWTGVIPSFYAKTEYSWYA